MRVVAAKYTATNHQHRYGSRISQPASSARSRNPIRDDALLIASTHTGRDTQSSSKQHNRWDLTCAPYPTNIAQGVKSYPRGVTTNSDGGIESYEVYYPVFEAMQEVGMVLNLHGEVPSSEETGVTVLNAEERFLPQLDKLAHSFPDLRIVVEHATTKAAVEKVKSLPSNVGCSITPHHLQLVVDDWAGQGFNFCKPVAKYWEDRNALRDVIREGVWP